jgi:hypothetical protein
MKYKLFLFCLIIFSCKSKEEKKIYYSDVKLSFYPSIHHIESLSEIFNTIGLAKFGGIDKSNYTWLRKNDNLLELHNIILNEIGYKNILNKNAFHSKMVFSFSDHIEWKNMSYNAVIDSLLFYRNKGTKNYYSKFWDRRIKEKNHLAVYKILTDVLIKVFRIKEIVKMSNF